MVEQSKTIKIVGIGGLPRSGKDTLASIMVDNGYFGLSLGDIVRNASRKRHADDPNPISVANMTETSNALRHGNGADFALKQALELYEEALNRGEKYKGLLVWSVRSPAEVDFILAHGGQLIWIETDDTVRLGRARRARRDGEPEWTMEELKAQEALQWTPQPDIPIPPEAQMNISYVKSKATKVFHNHSDDLELFNEEAKKIIHEISD